MTPLGIFVRTRGWGNGPIPSPMIKRVADGFTPSDPFAVRPEVLDEETPRRAHISTPPKKHQALPRFTCGRMAGCPATRESGKGLVFDGMDAPRRFSGAALAENLRSYGEQVRWHKTISYGLILLS